MVIKVTWKQLIFIMVVFVAHDVWKSTDWKLLVNAQKNIIEECIVMPSDSSKQDAQPKEIKKVVI